MPALILVADEDEGLRERVAWSLRAQGYRVLGVSNGESALWAMMMEQIDLFIVDIKMPKLDGASLLRLMRDDARLQHIPIVVITASPELAPPDLAVIAKPFAERLLTDIVNGMLAGRPRRRTAENIPPIESEDEDQQHLEGAPESSDLGAGSK